MASIQMMDVSIDDPGELSVGLIDQNGRILLRKRILLTGDPAIYGKSQFPLAIITAEGLMPVVPVLIHRSDGRQRIRFDGQPPATFTRKRARKVKVARGVLEKAIRPAGSDRVNEFGLQLSF